jgi:YD repeat-containing protein
MSRFAKHFGFVVLSIVALGSAMAATGNQTKGGVPPVSQHLVRPHAVATQSGLPPSFPQIESQMVQGINPGPGILYIQTYPTDQQQNAPVLHGHSRPFGVSQRPPSFSASRPRLHGRIVQAKNVVSGSPNLTGINAWWTYVGGNLPGVGKYLANVTTGNLLIQAGDMATPHKGIALTFTRTFNSFSQHDYANSDGSVPNNYGDGWTNTYDAHIAYNNLDSGLGVSVFDGNGARYDYSYVCNPTCGYLPPAGQYATLTYAGTTNAFAWTSKAGMVEWFNSPTTSASGVAGRLQEIVGRNSNTYLMFAYYFDTGFTDSAHLNQIRVVPEWAGPPASAISYVELQFDDYPNNSNGFNRLLHRLFWIDRSTWVEYNYSSSATLGTVWEPSNTSNTPNPIIPQTYTYVSNTHLVQSANGGRWNYTPAPGTDGGWKQFNYSGDAITSIQSFGFINPNVTDDSGTGPIQSSISSQYGKSTSYRTVVIVNSTVTAVPTPLPTPTSPPPACTTSSNTVVYDSDGRESWYCFDSTNRVSQTDYSTGSAWLTTKQTWDASNNLTSITDARTMKTDLAYDLNGNLIASALPAQNNSPRPTTYMTYDSHNNVVAQCDPVWSDANNDDWNATPAPSPCPANAANSPTNPGPTLYSYSPSPSNSFGELSAVTKPMGYKMTITYETGPQGGNVDYGLPATVAGTQIPQLDGTSVTQQTQYYYDQYGNTICAVTRGGIDGPQATYNTSINIFSGTNALLGRVTQHGDPDDASLSNSNANGPCPKTAGILGSTITTTYTYFTNGQLHTTQSPAERAAGVSTQYAYDLDSDPTTTITNFGSLGPATTSRFYDADDKLVEVVKPGVWDTRYDYDLSQNATTNISSVGMLGVTSSFKAHGALFKVQEYHGLGWIDMKGAAYDALDRSVDTFTYAPNANCTLNNLSGCENASVTSRVYDGTASAGMLDHTKDAVGTVSTFLYRNAGEVKSVSFSDGTGTQLGYDLDARVVSAAELCSPSCSTYVESYAYDRDGNQIQKAEQPENNSDPVMLTYNYYPDGKRESITLSGAINQSNLFTYDYDASGRPKNTNLTYNATTENFGFAQTSAGRPASETDPYSTTTATYDLAAGRLHTLTPPEGATSFSSFDPEGEVLAFTEPNQTTAVAQAFDSVGEMVGQTPPGQDPNHCTLGFTSVGSDGYMATTVQSYNSQDLQCESKGITGTEDVRNAIQTTEPVQVQCCHGINQFWEAVTFDADGRLTLGYNYSICCGQTSAQYTRAYDAQSRLLNQHDGSNNLQMKRIYGPDGHIDQIGTTDANHVLHMETLHWDGDAILFTTNENGQVDDIKIGNTADYFHLDTNSHAQLTVWDRDYPGHMRGCHNGGGHSSWSTLDPYNASGNPLPSITGCAVPAMYGLPIGQGGAILQPDGDGYWDGFVMIQGVRDFDSTLRGWIEPDPSVGTAWNPMTQKSYTWNNNNPSEFGDPTGSAASGSGGWGPQAAMMQLERADGNCESAFAGNCQTFAFSQAGVQFAANGVAISSGIAYTVVTDYSVYDPNNGVLLHETEVSTAYYTIQSGGSSEANSGFYNDWAKYGVSPTEYDYGGAFIYFDGPNPFYNPPDNMNSDKGSILLAALAIASKTPVTMAAGIAGEALLGAGNLLIAGSPTQQVIIPSNNLQGYMTGH